MPFCPPSRFTGIHPRPVNYPGVMSVNVGMVVEQMWQPVPGGSGRYIVEVASRLAHCGVRTVGISARHGSGAPTPGEVGLTIPVRASALPRHPADLAPPGRYRPRRRLPARPRPLHGPRNRLLPPRPRDHAHARRRDHRPLPGHRRRLRRGGPGRLSHHRHPARPEPHARHRRPGRGLPRPLGPDTPLHPVGRNPRAPQEPADPPGRLPADGGRRP